MLGHVKWGECMCVPIPCLGFYLLLSSGSNRQGHRTAVGGKGGNDVNIPGPAPQELRDP